MTLFVLIALSICLFALWLAVRPLLGSVNEGRMVDGDNSNISFLRSRLSELEQQHTSGKLDDDQFAALKDELESNLALEIDSSEVIKVHRDAGLPRQQRATARRTALILAVVLPLSSAAIYYYWVGNPEVVTLMAEVQTQEPAFDIAEVSEMVKEIETRLDANPDDLDGWRVLSRTYLGLGRYAEAERAYLQVLRLGGDNAVTFAALADASALNAQGQLSGKPMEYVSQALELDPQQPQALWLAGLNAVQNGDNASAKGYWQTLLPLLAEMPERQSELADILAQIDAETLLPGANAQGTKQDSAPVVADTTESSNASAVDGIRVSVLIDPSIISQLDPQTLVFVIARAVDGPRAPLAVKRYRVSTLPAQLVLSDRDSMMEQLQLSKFENIEISARVSLSGQPIASAGDFQATPVRIIQSANEVVRLVIDQELK
ncbi:MAG: c-type cytochrome biogenesis protein CcmI [Arenicella sp.]|nr:c-type cytochrome biogenesis protein CcmI [Arenicella sp.]